MNDGADRAERWRAAASFSRSATATTLWHDESLAWEGIKLTFLRRARGPIILPRFAPCEWPTCTAPR